VIYKPPIHKTAPPAISTKVSGNKMNPSIASADPSKTHNKNLFSSEPVSVLGDYDIGDPPM
jgi:hypothetical protein